MINHHDEPTIIKQYEPTSQLHDIGKPTVHVELQSRKQHSRGMSAYHRVNLKTYGPHMGVAIGWRYASCAEMASYG